MAEGLLGALQDLEWTNFGAHWENRKLASVGGKCVLKTASIGRQEMLQSFVVFVASQAF